MHKEVSEKKSQFELLNIKPLVFYTNNYRAVNLCSWHKNIFSGIFSKKDEKEYSDMKKNIPKWNSLFGAYFC